MSRLVYIFSWGFLWQLTFSACQPSHEDQAPVTSFTLMGGQATVFDQSSNAYSLESPHLSQEESRSFFRGRAFFRDPWVTAPASAESRDGLGPVFNARSCEACHLKDGRGRPPEGSEPFSSMLLRISIPDPDQKGHTLPVPAYGSQLQNLSVQGVPMEGNPVVTYQVIQGTYGDGQSYELLKPSYTIDNPQYGPLPNDLLISPRVAPAMIGLGLLEAIAEQTILDLADPEDLDRDGISGKANYVWDEAKKGLSLGRFGWKANQPNLKQQSAGAFLGDIGITSELFPEESCTEQQQACLTAISGGEPELFPVILEDVTFYSSLLAVPAQRTHSGPDLQKGQTLFFQGRCHRCHIPEIETGKSQISEILSHQTIHPFTDLLVHDMGEGLADNRPDFQASGREWRTPPLWGLGLLKTVNGHSRLLHDGRARSISEAILWHGGEASPSREFFRTLAEQQRQQLILFLESL